MTDNITFATQYVPEILNGNKWLTVRYGWEETPNAGDLVSLVDSNGRIFGEGMITVNTAITVEQFVESDFDGHESYGSVEEMCDRLKTFYPEADFDASTELTLLSFTLERTEMDLSKNP